MKSLTRKIKYIRVLTQTVQVAIQEKSDYKSTLGLIQAKNHLSVHLKGVERDFLRKEILRLTSEHTQEKNLITAQRKAVTDHSRLRGI